MPVLQLARWFPLPAALTPLALRHLPDRSEGGEARPARRGPSLDVDSQLRCNLIIALGDLALRFPNTVEPYTGGWDGAGVEGGEPALALRQVFTLLTADLPSCA